MTRDEWMVIHRVVNHRWSGFEFYDGYALKCDRTDHANDDHKYIIVLTGVQPPDIADDIASLLDRIGQSEVALIFRYHAPSPITFIQKHGPRAYIFSSKVVAVAITINSYVIHNKNHCEPNMLGVIRDMVGRPAVHRWSSPMAPGATYELHDNQAATYSIKHVDDLEFPSSRVYQQNDIPRSWQTVENRHNIIQ